MKKTLKLNIRTDDIESEDNSTPKVKDNVHCLKTPEKTNEKIDYNRGINEEERLNSKDYSELDLIKFYINSSNKNYDFSYHWFEKCNNLNDISMPIVIKTNNPGFDEPVRDYICEFELLKLITEDNYHKENLIELPKSLKRLNRYGFDIIPCKFLSLLKL